MRTFKIKVYFKKDILIQPEIVLVKNDYNSTEFEFEFDVEEGKKVFELKKPDETIIIKDIVDNKIVLVDYDEEGNVIPIINQSGEYNFEITCYDENSKITATQKGKFHARDEVVNIDEDKISENVKIPLLDSLINETIEATNNSKEQADYAKEQGDYAKEQGNYAKDVASNVESKLNNGDFVGATFKPSVDKEGNLSWTNDKGLDNPSSSNIMGPQGPQGIQGEAFTIKKTYSSKEEMNNDFGNMQIGDYVMITSNIELEDNAKMYSRGQEEWIFITDFSGATGIQGPQGIQGIQGIQGLKGDKGDKPIKGVDYFTETDKNEMVSSITNDANSEFNTNANEKLTEYNSNHEEKMQEYNSNAETKVNEFNEEVETLKDELNDCYNNQLVGQAEGTSVYINDSADARLRAIEIDGNLKQESTVGYNLLKFPYDNSIKSSDGLSWNANPDGSVKVSGTNNSDGTKYFDCSRIDGITLQPGTYTASLGCKSNVRATIANKEDINSVIALIKVNESETTFLLDEETTITFVLAVNAGLNVNSTVFPMLYSGEQTKKFEPYTGGQPSPNPDYPQEIEVLEAPNILPYPYTETSKTVNGITFTDNGDGTITLSGTATNDANFKLYGANDINNQLPILGNYISGGINNNIKIKVINKDTNGYTVLSTSSGNKEEIDLSVYKNGYIEILVNKNTICDNVVVKPMLTKTNKINSYIPYGCIETKVANKNILVLNNDSISGSRNGIDYVWDKEKLILNGTATVNFDIYNFGKWGDTTKDSKRLLKKGTYTLSVSGASHLGKFTTNAYFGKTRTFGLWKDAKKYTLTLNEDAYYSMFYINIVEGSSFNNETFYFQLEKGDMATDFESRQENSININLQGNFMAKLTDEIKDTLRIENGHAVLNKKIGKVILDGSESINKSYNNNYFSIVKDVPISNRGSEIYPIKSNYYISDMFDKIYSAYVNYGIAFNYTKPRVAIRNKDILTVEEFKQWLSEHNVELYYELAEPYDVDLGQVKLPKTFKGTSNIFLNVNLETNMQVDYVKDTQLVINDLQSQINNINTLLSTTNTSALLLDNLQSDLESEVI